jgi:hypothetical protein
MDTGADEVHLLQNSTVQKSDNNPTVDFSFHQEILADKNIPDDWILLEIANRQCPFSKIRIFDKYTGE